jgi:transposase
MKRDGRSVARAAQEEMRLLALHRMQAGEAPAAVAASFGFHRGWAYKVLARANGGGLDALRTRKGTGRPRTLTPAQEQRVLRWINGKDPRQYGFAFALWTRALVQTLIADRFGVSVSLATVGTILARLGLTPQKPLQRAYQRDPIAIAEWQAKTYPALVRRAKRRGAEIYFWDESGFRADTVHGQTWGRRGHTPVVTRPSQRQGINAASAVSRTGGFWFALYEGSLTGARFVQLLRRLMRGRRRPLDLVLDNLPVHKTAAVWDYIQFLRGKLTLHFLPSYAPELNPDELVWSYVKRTGVARNPLQAGERLDDRIAAQLTELAADPALIRSFFRHPSVAYITDR